MRQGKTRKLACIAAVCSLSARALAQDTEEHGFSVALQYTAGAGCPNASEFKTIVARRLGYDPFRAAARESLSVVIAPGEAAVEGRIEWRDSAGKWAGDQNFPSRSNDCRDLARAMGFAIAVQIDLLTAGAAADNPSETAPKQPPQPEPPRTEDKRAQPAPAQKPKISRDSAGAPAGAAAVSARGPGAAFGIGAGASVGFGLSSSVVPLGRVLGAVAWPHASLELATELGTATTTRRADGSGFSQRLILFGAAGCAAHDRWLACLVTKAGVIHVEGRSVDVPASPSGYALLAGLRLGVRQPLGTRAYVEARVEGLMNLARWTVTLDRTPVWTAPRFAETLGLDFGLLFR